MHALRDGGFIAKTIINDATAQAGEHYRLHDGRKVERDLVQRMVGDGLLIANGDDLFGDSQTYRRATNL